MWQFWLVLAGIFLVIEIINLGFMIFWFAVGSLIAMVVSFFIQSWLIQTAIFLVCSTLLLFATKPLVNKLMPIEPWHKTNVANINGKTAIVTQEIDTLNGKGQVKIDQEIWSAKSESDEVIPVDTIVIVEKIDGVKAIVKIKK